MISKEEQQKVSDKFFKDGDWYIVEKLLNEYLEPLRYISNIDTSQPNDVIAAEIRGRQIACEKLDAFLKDCRVLSQITSSKSGSFK